jgi:glycosyltransferase involved in cell wall biosynthesis
VVVTCFNEQEFIAETIRSILNQTRQPDQLVVVDDGSTDGSAGIIDAMGVRRLGILNRGMAGARNAGWAACLTDKIVFIDGDDLLAPTYISECLRHTGGVDAVVSAMEGEGLPGKLHPTVEDMWETSWLYACFMVKRRVLEETGGFHHTFLGDYDWGFWMDFVQRGYRVAYAPETFYTYRRHGGQHSQTLMPAERPGNLAEMNRLFR